jgi:hypothetical protein
MDWLVTKYLAYEHGIEGYADQLSAEGGTDVTLHVNTTAATFHVEVYRMGFYQGLGARLVHRTGEVRGRVQAPPGFEAGVNMVECRWSPSITLRIGDSWPPGNYLFKLVGSNGQQQYVPFTLRDDSSTAAVVMQNSVTTWQAYNLWGGYDLYGEDQGYIYGDVPVLAGAGYDNRSRIVSFDRPYYVDYSNGAGDWMQNEFPFLFFAERHGLDLAYWTDVDLHLRPELLGRHRCLVSLGHDEYWSASMREGAEKALASGVNLCFLGANACYRHIRLEASPTGPYRRVVCYKDAAEDPLYGVDNAEVTSDWGAPPLPRPESTLIGSMYQSYEANASMVVVDAGSWVFEGTGLADGDQLPGVIGSEIDGYEPSLPGPRNVQILCHSAADTISGPLYSDMTYYTRRGGGGVFASGTASFVPKLWNSPGHLPTDLAFLPVPGLTLPLDRIARNVLGKLSAGPASTVEPSKPTWQRYYSPSYGVASVE